MIEKTQSSVGIVKTQTAKIVVPPGGFRLKKGGSLPELQVAYETYGTLSPTRDNVIYICHALTGDSHVAGVRDSADKKPGWWDEMVGPGKGIDTNYYFVVCANILGGCMGTTGPSSINPSTGKPYGSSFPEITVTDMIHAQKLLLDQLGIKRLAAVVGGSLGGMQSLEWAVRYPDFVDRCICIASAASLSSQALSFDLVARDAIVSDPNWAGGDYYDKPNRPDWGLAHARKIGHITYLSPEIMEKKFGREKTPDAFRFQVESYLDYQGRKLVERFDANSYIRITQAIDSYDLGDEFGGLEKAFESVKSKFLVVALSSDWLFPPEQSTELANALLRAGRNVSYCTLDNPYGHDAFLVDIAHLSELIRAFLPWVHKEHGQAHEKDEVRSGVRKAEYGLILDMVRPSTRVLDLGCGDGVLLSLLSANRKSSGMGVDIDVNNVIGVIDLGHDIFQADIDSGLAMIPDGTYDFAILSETLQVVKRPRLVLREMLRVAREGIVSFPNFGRLRNRLQLGISGRWTEEGHEAPKWYDSQEIHPLSLRDFRYLCREEGIEIAELKCLPDRRLGRLALALGLRNLGAGHVLARITKKTR